MDFRDRSWQCSSHWRSSSARSCAAARSDHLPRPWRRPTRLPKAAVAAVSSRRTRRHPALGMAVRMTATRVRAEGRPAPSPPSPAGSSLGGSSTSSRGRVVRACGRWPGCRRRITRAGHTLRFGSPASKTCRSSEAGRFCARSAFFAVERCPGCTSLRPSLSGIPVARSRACAARLCRCPF